MEVKPTWKARSPTLCFGKLETRKVVVKFSLSSLGYELFGWVLEMKVGMAYKPWCNSEELRAKHTEAQADG